MTENNLVLAIPKPGHSLIFLYFIFFYLQWSFQVSKNSKNTKSDPRVVDTEPEMSQVERVTSMRDWFKPHLTVVQSLPRGSVWLMLSLSVFGFLIAFIILIPYLERKTEKNLKNVIFI